MQQVVRLRHVCGIGCGADQRVHQAAFGIDADMRLHAEVLLIALARLMHLGVPASRLVLGRARRRYDRGIDDSALPQHQPFRLQVPH